MQELKYWLAGLIFLIMAGCSENVQRELPSCAESFIASIDYGTIGNAEPEVDYRIISPYVIKVSVTIDLKDTVRQDDWSVQITPSFQPDFHWAPHLVASNQPHTPWNRGPAHLYDEDKLTIPEYMVDSRETRRNLKSYYAEITYADSLLGACLKYLEEAGKSENTIVIFTSEQGSQFPFAKWTCYDLGLKTAFIMRWPGKVEPGSRTNALTQYVDVVPTLLDAAGKSPDDIHTGIANISGGGGFDGQSFLPVVLQQKQKHRDYVYGIQTTRGIYSGSVCYPVRSVRSDRYKYIINLHSSSSFFNLVNTPAHGLYSSWLRETANDPEKRTFVDRYTIRPKEELYDIINDPFEMNNLAGQPELASVKRELIFHLKVWMDSQGDLGLETEMNALTRIPKTLAGGWSDYHEESVNRAILNVKP